MNSFRNDHGESPLVELFRNDHGESPLVEL